MAKKREANGRFAKGNGGGPGRPKQERERRYLEVTVDCVPFAQWERIVKRAAKDAEAGDAVARRWLGDYLLGPPQKRVDVTTDGKPIKSELGGLASFVALVDELPAGAVAQGSESGGVGGVGTAVDTATGPADTGSV